MKNENHKELNSMLNKNPDFYEVEYSDDMVVLKEFGKEESMKALTTKKKCYTFEEEWRMVMPVARKPIPFDKKMLKAIYFGKKMSVDRAFEIKKVMKLLGYREKYYKMQTNFNQHNYKFIELSK